jgi:O-antigen/teichoic acid export membrane protein
MPLFQREASMAGIRLFDVHRTWEDYAGIILGVLIGLSPWLTGDDVKLLAMGNAVVVGGLVFALAAFELVDLNRSEEVGEIVLALWLIASPFVLDYVENSLAIWHFVLGAVVAVLAGLERWQDWSLTERELMRHGR